jgi:hypothetical protein
MKALSIIFLSCAFMLSQLEACVTVDPGTGTYTVDKSGCVDQGNRQAPKPAKNPASKKK